MKNKKWIQDLPQHINIYKVGGCVRDEYLGLKPKDIDLVVENTNITEIIEYLKSYGKTNLVGESFGVIKFKPFNESETYDIALTRKDRKVSEGHKGFEIDTDKVSIKEDLKRRDFTINSIAVNIKTDKIIDPMDGIDDIKNKTIRVNNKKSFSDDPLRILRAIQFSIRFNFEIENKTESLIRNNINLINQISRERVLIEFEKIRLTGAHPNRLMEMFFRLNINEYNYNLNIPLYAKLNTYESRKNSLKTTYDKASFYFIMFYYELNRKLLPHAEFLSLKGDIKTYNGIKFLYDISEKVLFDKNNNESEVDKCLYFFNKFSKFNSLDDILEFKIFTVDRRYKIILYYINLFRETFPDPTKKFLDGNFIMETCNIKPSILIQKLRRQILEEIFSGLYKFTDIETIKQRLIYHNQNDK